MISRFSTLLLHLLHVCLFLGSTANAQDAPHKQGFRVQARRRPGGHSFSKRSAGGAIVSTSHTSGYEIPISISGQALTMGITSASADMWVASTLMTPKVQKTLTTGKIFNPNTSATYRVKEGYSFSIAYGDGSTAKGPIGVDEVSIGEATVQHMPFGTASNWTFAPGFVSLDTTGELGLAFRSINSVSPSSQCTFMECLQPTLPEPIFSASLSLTQTGYLDFGFVDPYAYTGEFTKLVIDNSTGFWLANDVGIGTNSQNKNKPSNSILDLGTTILSLPSESISQYAGQVQGAKYDNASDVYKVPCGTHLPDLELNFTHVTSGSSTVAISGHNLLQNSSSTYCFLAMSSSDGLGFSILGAPFFADRYVVFNQSEPSVLFAAATGNGTITPPPDLTSGSSTNTSQNTSSTTSPKAGNHESKATTLSTGAKAGIGIAVAVAALLLIALGVWAIRRRKAKRSKAGTVAGGSTYEGKPELEGQEKQRAELADQRLAEMSGHGRPVELKEDVRHELPGADWAGELPAGERG